MYVCLSVRACHTHLPLLKTGGEGKKSPSYSCSVCLLAVLIEQGHPSANKPDSHRHKDTEQAAKKDCLPVLGCFFRLCDAAKAHDSAQEGHGLEAMIHTACPSESTDSMTAAALNWCSATDAM